MNKQHKIVDPKDISGLLKHYREKVGISQREMARRLGTEHNYAYRQYEAQPKKIGLILFDRIIRAMGLELVMLITDKPLTKRQMDVIHFVIQSEEEIENFFKKEA